MQTFRNIKFVLIEYFKINPFGLIITLFSAFYNSLNNVITAYIIKVLIDNIVSQLTTHTFDQSLLLTPLILITAVDISYFVFQYGENYYQNVMTNQFAVKMNLQIVEKIAKLEQSTIESPDFQNRLEKITNQSIQSFTDFYIHTVDMLGYLVGMISAAIAMLTVPVLFLLGIILVIPNYFFQRSSSRFRLKIYEARKPLRRKRNYLFGVLIDEKESPEIKITQAANFIINKYRELSEISIQDAKDVQAKSIRNQIPMGFTYVISQFAILGYLAIETVMGVITIGDFTFLRSQFFNFRDQINSFARTLESFHDGGDYVRDFYELMQMPTHEAEEEKKYKLTSNDINITFENVSFKYPESNHYALKNLNFTINNGEKIAFVGQNGAGKTTLIKLLSRFYTPTKGRILINGVDLQEINLASWYYKLGALFQDYNRYNFTVRENIGIGRVEDISNIKKIKDASQKSGAEEVINKLDGKYEQILGKTYEKGTELSGGQWQKIALARAYMRSPEVLMLDEPTAAIDAKAEAEIFEKLQDLGQGKTLILISHRFSTVRQVDKIYVIENGTIQEHGTHQELMAIKDGRYAEMYNLQAKMYN